MENCSHIRIARIISLLDELWSVIDLLFTFIIHFGGEHVNGIFYQLELQADLGLLHPDQVMGKRALMGLLFFLSLLVNLLWIFAAFILFKATDTTHCTASYRKRLQYCKIWLSASVVLLVLHLCNMLIYLKESFLQMGLALSAFLTRSVFLYFVRKFMRELELNTLTTTMVMTPVRVQYAHHANGQGPTRRQRQGSGESPENETLFSSSSSHSHSVNDNNVIMSSRKYLIVSNHPNHNQAQICSNNNHHSHPVTITPFATHECYDILSNEEMDQESESNVNGSPSTRTNITLNPLAH